MRAFEIQTYREGRWKIDAVFDDRELALFEAKRMDDGNRFSGVRVIEETYEEASDKTTSRTIFRGGRAQSQAYKVKTPPPRAKPGGAARGGGRDRKGGGAKRVKKKKKSGFTGPLVILTLLVVVGLTGLFGLQHLFG